MQKNDNAFNVNYTCIPSLTPSTPDVPHCCCLKGSAPYWSNPLFLIFDIWALWRSVLSARAPEIPQMSKIENGGLGQYGKVLCLNGIGGKRAKVVLFCRTGTILSKCPVWCQFISSNQFRFPSENPLAYNGCSVETTSTCISEITQVILHRLGTLRVHIIETR